MSQFVSLYSTVGPVADYDMKASFSQSSALTPLVFLLSSGSDPLADVTALAAAQSIQMVTLSLGEGQVRALDGCPAYPLCAAFSIAR